MDNCLVDITGDKFELRICSTTNTFNRAYCYELMALAYAEDRLGSSEPGALLSVTAVSRDRTETTIGIPRVENGGVGPMMVVLQWRIRDGAAKGMGVAIAVVYSLSEGETDDRTVIPHVETGGSTVMGSVENLRPVVEPHDGFRQECEWSRCLNLSVVSWAI